MAPNLQSSAWITVHKWNSPISLRNKQLEQEKLASQPKLKPVISPKSSPKELRPFQARATDPIELIDAELAKLREAPSKVRRFCGKNLQSEAKLIVLFWF